MICAELAFTLYPLRLNRCRVLKSLAISSSLNSLIVLCASRDSQHKAGQEDAVHRETQKQILEYLLQAVLAKLSNRLILLEAGSSGVGAR